MIPEATIYKIQEIISKAKKICLVLHGKPDGDTVGAGLAMAQYLDSLGKPHLLFCPTPMHGTLLFLRGTDKITSNQDLVLNFTPDLIIALDASDLHISGLEELIPRFSVKPFLINIDHHKTNTHYGDLNIVLGKVASTTQIIFDLFKKWEVEVTKEIAEALLFGLIVDTSSFTNPATTEGALSVAGKLICQGANFNYLLKKFSKKRSLPMLKILGEALKQIVRNEDLDVVCAVFKEEDFQKQGLSLEEADGVTNIFNNLSEGKISLVIKETLEGFLNCSMRTTKEEINLGALAKLLGGGGHLQAAGFTIKGKAVRMENGSYKII